MNALLDLAERCEAATGPDRELDRNIELTLPGVLPHPDGQQFDNDLGHREPYVISGAGHPDHEPGQGYIPSRYTASLDAAMTLVPEGLHVVHAGEARFMTRAPAFAVTVEEWATLGEGDDTMATYPVRLHGVAGTFPLALCAAALRARAEEQSALNREGGNG